MHQTDVLDWDETDAGEGSPPPPPQMVFNIVSNDVLQLTFTKTALEVFKNLSQVGHCHADHLTLSDFLECLNLEDH